VDWLADDRSRQPRKCEVLSESGRALRGSTGVRPGRLARLTEPGRHRFGSGSRLHADQLKSLGRIAMLFEPFDARSLHLKNRIVMAPMTRSRAVDVNTPNELMAEYYAQRASAGLIVTEGTSPSPNGLGYARIPGLYSQVHVKGWQAVTTAVHARGGKMFVQLMHTGRVSHLANLPPGARVIGPTAGVCPGEMYTDAHGMQPHSVPHAMTDIDIAAAVQEFAESARLAVAAGFDGVELHAANGYLIEQFLNPIVNARTDGYGGGVAGRNRFAIEVARATVAAIGADRVGIRLSPYGVFNGTGPFPELEQQYLALAAELSSLGLLYLHLVDHSSMGAPTVPADFKLRLHAAFNGLFILSGGFDRDSAEAALQAKRGDLVAFGRPFLANPDLVARLRAKAQLATPDMATFYTPGAKGYTDYPAAGA
jgi:N-ethylmaleimide reductase